MIIINQYIYLVKLNQTNKKLTSDYIFKLYN